MLSLTIRRVISASDPIRHMEFIIEPTFSRYNRMNRETFELKLVLLYLTIRARDRQENILYKI